MNSSSSSAKRQSKPSVCLPHSTSQKRCVQNRDAQRAFRERKAEYVKELEEKVRHAEVERIQFTSKLQETARKLSEENQTLKSVVLRLHGDNQLLLNALIAANLPIPTSMGLLPYPSAGIMPISTAFSSATQFSSTSNFSAVYQFAQSSLPTSIAYQPSESIANLILSNKNNTGLSHEVARASPIYPEVLPLPSLNGSWSPVVSACGTDTGNPLIQTDKSECVCGPYTSNCTAFSAESYSPTVVSTDLPASSSADTITSQVSFKNSSGTSRIVLVSADDDLDIENDEGDDCPDVQCTSCMGSDALGAQFCRVLNFKSCTMNPQFQYNAEQLLHQPLFIEVERGVVALTDVAGGKAVDNDNKCYGNMKTCENGENKSARDYVPCETVWQLFADHVYTKQLTISELCSWLAMQTRCSHEGPMVESKAIVEAFQRLSLEEWEGREVVAGGELARRRIVPADDNTF
ncbi:hypothetical protein BC937DRAFT_91736 [Endogone sp. FLAS-F59071]|nr:hypothetical protein BC937DRAFT_91736 [Endogone sp. FLAS-F59071]|eukprot:RUS15974.1 hypothetical protein BC937DRAFT_91736 [Endogone sp. FLAS-F59071]